MKNSAFFVTQTISQLIFTLLAEKRNPKEFMLFIGVFHLFVYSCFHFEFVDENIFVEYFKLKITVAGINQAKNRTIE